MLSNIAAPAPIMVPSPSAHQQDSLPLPTPTPGGRPSSTSGLLPERSNNLIGDDETHHKTSSLSAEVRTLRMLFGGSILLLMLCITMLIIVSVVPLRNAAMPLGLKRHHAHGKGARGGMEGRHHKVNPFHFVDGPLEELGSIDGMVLEGLQTADGTLVERYYRIQRVTRTPAAVYQQGEEEALNSVRVEFFGGDFIIADKLSAALFRRRDAQDEMAELECAPLVEADTEGGEVEDVSTPKTTPSSVYCAVALILNPEIGGNSPPSVDEASPSNRTRVLQGRTSINFPYRDGSVYESKYGRFSFNTGRIYRYGAVWNGYDVDSSFKHRD